MGDIVTQLNIGAIVAEVTSVFPQSSTGATIDGASIDRFAHQGALSCLLHQSVGAVSGSPSTVSVQSTLQHSPDNSTWTNYEPDGVTVQQTAALTAATDENSVAIDLSSAYRYIRSVTVVAFTGGSSPAAVVQADIVLGGQQLAPAV